MNHARLEVGLQGVSLAERSYQDALAYAKERKQGRDPETGESADIIQHADVQRMLMTMKSLTEAMRALTYDGAWSHDLRLHGADEDERRRFNERFALLTPVIKAWCTELVNEVTSLGIQVHGGMGFIEETGVAQHYRDARIASIYEGTNGIQANDLVGRKILRDQGAAMTSYIEEIRETATAITGDASLSRLAEQLNEAADNLAEATRFVVEKGQSHPKMVGAVAYNFLMMTGYVAGAWYVARAAQIAQQADSTDDYYRKRLVSARFYFDQILPRHVSHMNIVTGGAEVGVALTRDDF